MIIRSITLNNYRLYKGVNTLSFINPDEKNIMLISGEKRLWQNNFLTFSYMVLVWKVNDRGRS